MAMEIKTTDSKTVTSIIQEMTCIMKLYLEVVEIIIIEILNTYSTKFVYNSFFISDIYNNFACIVMRVYVPS